MPFGSLSGVVSDHRQISTVIRKWVRRTAFVRANGSAYKPIQPRLAGQLIMNANLRATMIWTKTYWTEKSLTSKALRHPLWLGRKCYSLPGGFGYNHYWSSRSGQVLARNAG
jgi:hypothetical protein